VKDGTSTLAQIVKIHLPGASIIKTLKQDCDLNSRKLKAQAGIKALKPST
jgi:hypothetical protein